MEFSDYHNSNFIIEGTQKLNSKSDFSPNGEIARLTPRWKNQPVFIEKFENEYGDDSKLLAHLDSSENQGAEARIKKSYYLIEEYCKNFKLLVENLLGKNEPIVIDDLEIECRHKSIVELSILGSVRILMQKTKRLIFEANHFL